MDLEVQRNINAALNAGGADEDCCAAATVGIGVAGLLGRGFGSE
jgi:hypothetical protein